MDCTRRGDTNLEAEEGREKGKKKHVTSEGKVGKQ